MASTSAVAWPRDAAPRDIWNLVMRAMVVPLFPLRPRLRPIFSPKVLAETPPPTRPTSIKSSISFVDTANQTGPDSVSTSNTSTGITDSTAPTGNWFECKLDTGVHGEITTESTLRQIRLIDKMVKSTDSSHICVACDIAKIPVIGEVTIKLAYRNPHGAEFMKGEQEVTFKIYADHHLPGCHRQLAFPFGPPVHVPCWDLSIDTWRLPAREVSRGERGLAGARADRGNGTAHIERADWSLIGQKPATVHPLRKTSKSSL